MGHDDKEITFKELCQKAELKYDVYKKSKVNHSKSDSLLYQDSKCVSRGTQTDKTNWIHSEQPSKENETDFWENEAYENE